MVFSSLQNNDIAEGRYCSSQLVSLKSHGVYFMAHLSRAELEGHLPLQRQGALPVSIFAETGRLCVRAQAPLFFLESVCAPPPIENSWIRPRFPTMNIG